jgi:predicted TIM-barrel fold metal-dependent hydrolase
MIIDFHAHTFPETVAPKAVAQLEARYGYPASGQGTLDDLLAKTRSQAIDLTVLHAAATRPGQVRSINDRAAALQAAHPVVAFGSLHPDYHDIEGEVERLKDLGVIGIKFHPDFQEFYLDSPKAMRMYEAIGSDLLVLFHVGDRRNAGFTNYATPQRMVSVADAFPHLKLIAAHLGGYRMWQEATECLVGRPLFLDTSSALSLMPQAEVMRIIQLHGVDRVIWGSDYPLWDPAVELAALRALPLTDEEKARILGGNAHALLTGALESLRSRGSREPGPASSLLQAV